MISKLFLFRLASRLASLLAIAESLRIETFFLTVNQHGPDITVVDDDRIGSDHDVSMEEAIALNSSASNEFIVDENSDDEETQDVLYERANEADDFHIDDLIPQPKVNEAKLLDMLDKVQKENQILMNLFEKKSAFSIYKSQQGATNTSSWLTDERRDHLDKLLGEKFSDHRDEIERQTILANPMHRDFYLLLTRKLYCMINSCENLSTGMVSSGNKELVQKYKSSMLRHTSKQSRDTAMTAIGIVVSTALTAVKESIPGVKIVAEPLHAMFNVIVSVQGKRDQYLAVARVADFANAASILQAGNSNALQSTIENFARLMIRARASLPSFPFTEKQDKFGRIRQYMVNMLADSGNTPIKEQASLAADCAVAHIMMPSKGSILNDILNGDNRDANLSEALAAAMLNISIDEIRLIDRFSMECADISEIQIVDYPTNNNATFVLQPSSDDESDADLDFNVGHRKGIIDVDSNYGDCSRPIPSTSANVEHLEDKVGILERKIEGLSNVQRSFQSKLKKEDANSSAGDGLMYADFREQYKDDVNMLKRRSVDCDERVSFHASEIAILKEQVQLLQKQLSESTIASSLSSQPISASTERTKSGKIFERKRWISRRRDPKDP